MKLDTQGQQVSIKTGMIDWQPWHERYRKGKAHNTAIYTLAILGCALLVYAGSYAALVTPNRQTFGGVYTSYRPNWNIVHAVFYRRIRPAVWETDKMDRS